MWQVVLGGAIVLGGVVLTDWLTSQRERRRIIRNHAAALAFSIPTFAALYSANSESLPRDGDFLDPYWRYRQDVISMLSDLRTLPRWPVRNARKIRDSAEVLLTMLVAVELRHSNGIPTSATDRLHISLANELQSLVTGTGILPEIELNRYVNDGFGGSAANAGN